jgi:hypothetical protein
MIKFFSSLLLLAGLTSLGRSAPIAATDLGNDLSYLQVNALTGAAQLLPPSLAQPRAVVLDLRYATTDEAGTASLRAALKQHPAGAPLYILLSPDTPPDVVTVVNQTPGTCFTLGLSSAKSAARIQVRTDAASDLRAYEALAAGTAPSTLISGKITKERFDEATLVQEFKNGNPDAEPPAPPDPTVTKQGGAEVHQDGPLVDRVLQRAVHLHQALLALRREG